MNGTIGMVRGFFIALAVSVGLPVALIPLSLTSPGFAMLYAYVIAPQLVYLYPAYLCSFSRAHAPLLSLLQMLLLSFLFGVAMSDRSGGSQLRWALLVLSAWWLAWRLAGLAFGLQPDFAVRM